MKGTITLSGGTVKGLARSLILSPSVLGLVSGHKSVEVSTHKKNSQLWDKSSQIAQAHKRRTALPFNPTLSIKDQYSNPAWLVQK